MSEVFKPILFQGEMVRAILNGSKTQTRRLIKHHHAFKDYPDKLSEEEIKERRNAPLSIPAGYEERCIEYLVKNCKFKVGQVLWVRETWMHHPNNRGEFKYQSTASKQYLEEWPKCWNPSIHMPKEAARIFLMVKSVRVERLQSISPADAIAEGIQEFTKDGNVMKYGIDGWDWGTMPRTPEAGYKALWESINGAGSWETPQWVWVIEFEHLKDFKNPWNNG
jgi:hypothetical protein